MSVINLEILIDKLNGSSHVALESALGMVASMGQRAVELPHWLYHLMQIKDSDWQGLVDEVIKDKDACLSALREAVERFPQGHDSAPSLSQSVIDAACEAWLMASLESGLSQVTPGFLFAAILNDTMLRQEIISAVPYFKGVNQAALRAACIASGQALRAQQATETMASHAKAATPAKQGETALSLYTVDMTALATSGQMDPIIGREYEIQQMIDVLLRRRQNNPILTGEPGVGKTACVEGFAQRIANNEVPDALKGVRVHSLDLTLLQAGASVKGEFEKRLKQLIDEVQSASPAIILFIDEAHLLIGAGGNQGVGDAANMLKPALARGQLRTIAATTWREYKQYFETDAALTRRFQPVTIAEPSIDNAIAMLRSVAPKLEKHHGIHVRDEAVIAAVNLSHRYLSERKLPDKALSLLDTACARAISPREGEPFSLIALQATIAKTEQAIAALTIEGELVPNKGELEAQEKALLSLKKEKVQLEKHIKKEKTCLAQLNALERTRDKLDPDNFQQQKKSLIKQLRVIQKKQCLMPYAIDKALIARVLSGWTGVPVSNMLQDKQDKLTALDAQLNQRVHGQGIAIDRICRTLITSGAGLSKPNKPLGVFLLAGPSGVGKTETAYAIAEQLFGSADKMTTINMSEFKEAHKVSTLTGSPPGYVGYGEGGVLTEAVRRQPHSLILLDEMEKAHSSVQDIFYNMLDRGVLRDSEGRDIDFKQTVVMMTANAADNFIADYADKLTQGDADTMQALQEALEVHFKPAFLGRVTVVPYLPLSTDTMSMIIQSQLNQLADRVQSHYGLHCHYDATVIEHVLEACHIAQTGARQVAAIIDSTIAPLIAKTLLAEMGKVQKGKITRDLKLIIKDNDYAVVWEIV